MKATPRSGGIAAPAFTVSDAAHPAARQSRPTMRMKRAGVALLAFLVLSLSAGFALGAGPYIRVAGPALPPAIPEALFAYITSASPYAKWGIMPGSTMFRLGLEPHGVRQNIHVNAVAYSALRAKSVVLPEGSILVKEVYGPDKKVAELVVYYKALGAGPEAKDRLWVRYAPDGTVVAHGAGAGCMSCHGSAQKSDYVLFDPKK